jgi:hypothetical protein
LKKIGTLTSLFTLYNLSLYAELRYLDAISIALQETQNQSDEWKWAQDVLEEKEIYYTPILDNITLLISMRKPTLQNDFFSKLCLNNDNMRVAIHKEIKIRALSYKDTKQEPHKELKGCYKKAYFELLLTCQVDEIDNFVPTIANFLLTMVSRDYHWKELLKFSPNSIIIACIKEMLKKADSKRKLIVLKGMESEFPSLMRQFRGELNNLSEDKDTGVSLQAQLIMLKYDLMEKSASPSLFRHLDVEKEESKINVTLIEIKKQGLLDKLFMITDSDAQQLKLIKRLIQFNHLDDVNSIITGLLKEIDEVGNEDKMVFLWKLLKILAGVEKRNELIKHYKDILYDYINKLVDRLLKKTFIIKEEAAEILVEIAQKGKLDGLTPEKLSQIITILSVENQKKKLVEIFINTKENQNSYTFAQLFKVLPSYIEQIAKEWIRFALSSQVSFLFLFNDALLQYWQHLWVTCIEQYDEGLNELSRFENEVDNAEFTEIEELKSSFLRLCEPLRQYEYYENFIASIDNSFAEISFSPHPGTPSPTSFPTMPRAPQYSNETSITLTRIITQWLRHYKDKIFGKQLKSEPETLINEIKTLSKEQQENNLNNFLDLALALISKSDSEGAVKNYLIVLLEALPMLRERLIKESQVDDTWMTEEISELLGMDQTKSSSSSYEVFFQSLKSSQSDFQKFLEVTREKQSPTSYLKDLIQNIENQKMEKLALERLLYAVKFINDDIRAKRMKVQFVRQHALEKIAHKLGKEFDVIEATISVYLQFRKHLSQLGLKAVEEDLGGSIIGCKLTKDHKLVGAQHSEVDSRYLIKTMGGIIDNIEMAIWPAIVSKMD